MLARYANLVLECESDLNLLASPQSLVDPMWMSTLLATALDPRMQDQNRKFTGEWMLRSAYGSNKTLVQDSAATLCNGFLPWATQGSLFVSTLKQQQNGVVTSLHGERLANLIATLLNQEKAQSSMRIANVLLRFLVERQNNLFAYAGMYILEGIGRAFDGTLTLPLQVEHIDLITQVSAWVGLPEVARDHLTVRCWKVLQSADSTASTKLSAIAKTRMEKLRAAATHLISLAGSGPGQTLTEALRPSNNDDREQDAMKGCNILHLELSKADGSLDPARLKEMIRDIWGDMEHLEFPKELLFQFTHIVLDKRLMKIALQNDDLRIMINEYSINLEYQAERKTYLLAPFAVALRRVCLLTPDVAQVLPLDDLILRLARNPPEAGIDLRLEHAAADLLSKVPGCDNLNRERYFGKGEGHGFAAFLDFVGRLGQDHGECVESVLKHLLGRWRRQKQPIPTISPWKNTLQLQVMLLCCEQYTATAGSDDVNAVLQDLHYALSIEPLPRYRYVLEWMIARVYIKHVSLQQDLLKRLSTKDHHANPKFLASLMKLGTTLAAAGAVDESLATQLAIAFIALSSSSKIVVRHEAQWSFPKLINIANAEGWASITQNPAYTALNEYVRSLPRWDDPPPERVMSSFNPMKDHNLTHLVEGAWTQLDYTRPPYSTHADFARLYVEDLEEGMTDLPPAFMPLGDPSSSRPSLQSSKAKATSVTLQLNDLDFSKQPEAMALQTKGTAYLLNSFQDSLGASSGKKSDLIVLASLVDNPYNLGGLSRCSEIFGAQALYLQDPRVISNKDFASVSVSSHNHIPIQPLLAANIASFCAGKKGDGWTIVGIEQTDRSVLLGSPESTMPEKTVLILGSEKEGMPGSVLAECDILVEIPQQGVTRSLNVQTAAAIVLYEWKRQHAKNS